jgi:hypothetical protein
MRNLKVSIFDSFVKVVAGVVVVVVVVNIVVAAVEK